VGWCTAMNPGACDILDLWRTLNEELPKRGSELRHNRLCLSVCLPVCLYLPFNNSGTAEPTSVKIDDGGFINSF
jgi:hypothetical protein